MDNQNNQPVVQQNNNDNEKLFAILSYFGILSIIVLYVVKPKTEYGIFHAKQASNLFIIQAIVNVITSVISFILKTAGVTSIGNILGIVGTFIWVMSILGIVSAANGKMDELPIVGKIKIIK